MVGGSQDVPEIKKKNSLSQPISMHCNVDTICIEVNVARSQDIPEIPKKIQNEFSHVQYQC